MAVGREQAVRVEGLRELSRAFAVADKTLATELRKGLRKAAEPVGSDAAAFAASGIRNIGDAWSQMRIGVTRTGVYVAPKQRSTRAEKRKRRNLADLLLARAMLPALDRNAGDVEHEVDRVLATVGRAWESA